MTGKRPEGQSSHYPPDCPDLIACTPPGFNYIERARPRKYADDANMLTNHGGVYLFYHSTLHAKRISFVDYLVFEYVALPVQYVTHVIGYVVEFLKTAYDSGRSVHYILKFVVDRFRCVRLQTVTVM